MFNNFKARQDEASEKGENVGRNLIRRLYGNTDKYRLYFSDYQFDEVDFILINIQNGNTYVGDVKQYHANTVTRNHNYLLNNGIIERTYPNYEIDYEKLEQIKERSKMIEGSTPILVVFFADCVMVWDLNISSWEKTKHNRKGNKYSSDQTQKEITPKANLYFKDAIYISNKIKKN